MLERPLLYILSPRYVQESLVLDESTSIYERVAPDVIQNELIARQLRYFARTSNKTRPLIMQLDSGERLLGEILSIQGTDVKVACFEHVRLINANTIVAIYTTK